MSIFSRKSADDLRRPHHRRRGHLRRLHHRRLPHPHRLQHPPRDGHHGPWPVHRLRRHRAHRRRDPRELRRLPHHPDRQRRHRLADRDGHLRSEDFFHAEENKEITFVSTKVERDGDDWTITGDLTIKGETKPVTIDFESNGSARDPFGNLRVGFEGGTAINRKDWGLTWNAALETGGVLVSEKIKLEFDVSAIKNV